MPLDPNDAEARLAKLGRQTDPTTAETIDFFNQALGLTLTSAIWWSDNGWSNQIGRGFAAAGIIRKPLFLRSIQGKFGAALHKALEKAPNMPYMSGSARLPFRAPGIEFAIDKNKGTVLLSAYMMSRTFNQPPAVYAEWSGYLKLGFIERPDLILAGAIDSGDQAVYDVLVQTIRGEHPVGVVSRTAIRALLLCERPDAWNEVEQLLLKAQREEGLRQTILESIDEVHPNAFRKFLRTIIEHDLLRFSSVLRAFALWFPELWKEGDARSGSKVLLRLLEFLGARDLIPDKDDPTDVYLRLWSFAFEDVTVAITGAGEYLSSPNPAIRRTAARILSQIGLSHTFSLLTVALQDKEETVASVAVGAFSNYRNETLIASGLAPVFRRVAEGWTSKKQPGISSRQDVWDLVLRSTPEDNYLDLVDVIGEMSVTGRCQFGNRLSKVTSVEKRRQAALTLIGDPSVDVRKHAMNALGEGNLHPDEAPIIEDLLRRKASDLRLASMKLLARQSPAHVIASGDRLLGSVDANQRLAGLELLVGLADEGKNKSARERVEQYVESRTGELTEHEKPLVSRLELERQDSEKPTIDNGFGLVSTDKIKFYGRPPRTRAEIYTPGAMAFLRSLDQLIHDNRSKEITYARWGGVETDANRATSLIGDLPAGFCRPDRNLTYEEDRKHFPLAFLTEPWFESRPAETRDPDGQEVLRASLIVLTLGYDKTHFNEAKSHLERILPGLPELQKALNDLRHPRVLASAVRWIAKQAIHEQRNELLIDMLSERVAAIAKDEFMEESTRWTTGEKSWRTDPIVLELIDMVSKTLKEHPDSLDGVQWVRAYEIFRYIDEPFGERGRPVVEKLRSDTLNVGPRSISDAVWDPAKQLGTKVMAVPPRRPCPVLLLDKAFTEGACNRDEVWDHLGFYNFYERTWNLSSATHRGFSPEFRDLVDQYVDRLVEIEASRGELVTSATEILRKARSGIYVDQVRRLLAANVAISTTSTGSSRAGVMRELFMVSKPRPEETPEICATAFKQDKIKPERLLEVAMLSPQWAAAAEATLGWEGLTDAIWWVHAHTKDEKWGVEQEIKELWAGEISERTPLLADELLNGAVDVDWFNRFRSKFDTKRWKQVENLAKFAARGNGHGRAKLFAQAMIGEVTAAELEKRIEEKRPVDAVRALGLVPLADDSEAEVRHRYAILQEFLRSSRQFGSMRQASEKMAVTIGLENLARTAGYPDPLRLTWALEAREVEDLKGGGKEVVSGDLTVRLFFDELGDPQVSAVKNGKALKEIPAAEKKNPEIKELTERRTALKKQASRMRLALELAMQRGDEFEPGEVRNLLEHPGLAPMLQNLVFLSADGMAGFGDALPGAGNLRIAHPYDLLQRGDWPEWQHAVFSQERVQPFRQVFRELYVPTETEKSASESTRYGGHQLQPRQAIGILSKRGWIIRAEEGVSKTLHESRLTAWINFDEAFYSPADIEGLTLQSLHFTRAGDWKPIPLSEVPPKVFSETMRDLDLLVSVASSVGIDPEASESTVEMRASVVRELALLMGLGNVSLKAHHAVIGGKLGEYTVHLGSGTVHQRARGELVIIAVRQPQRGRLFLPFIDDDPRTAEIASKVLLLARDNEIKDPTILRQMVGS